MVMTAAHDPLRDDPPFLEEALHGLELPEGLRAQLIDGEIILTEPPDGNHEHALSELFRQVYQRAAADLQISGHKGLLIPAGPGGPRDHLIPDATFIPDEPGFGDAPPWMAPAGITMVAEVTGINPDRDRTTKARCYATGGIPYYLLVDRERATVTLGSDPDAAKGRYARHATVDFGRPLPLPEPFGFDLETADLA